MSKKGNLYTLYSRFAFDNVRRRAWNRDYGCLRMSTFLVRSKQKLHACTCDMNIRLKSIYILYTIRHFTWYWRSKYKYPKQYRSISPLLTPSYPIAFHLIFFITTFSEIPSIRSTHWHLFYIMIIHHIYVLSTATMNMVHCRLPLHTTTLSFDRL